jgi:predicted Zn finger-like uncharacterized protein
MIITCPNCSTRFRLNADQLGDTGRNVKCTKCDHRWFADLASLSDEPPRSGAPGYPALQQALKPQSQSAEGEKLSAPPEEEAPDEEAIVSLPSISPPSAEAEVPSDPPVEKVSNEDEEAIASPPPIPSEEEIARFQSNLPTKKKSTLIWWIVLLVVVVLVVGSLFVFRRDIVAFYPPANKLYMVLGPSADVLGSGLEIPDYDIVSRQEGNKRILSIKGEIKNTTAHVLDVPLLFGAIKDSKGQELRIWSFSAKEPRVLAGEAVAYETEVSNPPRGGINVSITFTTELEMEAKKAARTN